MKKSELNFPIWKTISVDYSLTIEDYLLEFQNKSITIPNLTKKILLNTKIEINNIIKHVNLVKINNKSFSENGITNIQNCEQIISSFEVEGLLICDLQTALQLRLNYFDQEEENILEIIMRPVEDINENQYHLFLTSHKKQLYLSNLDYFFRVHTLLLETELVFSID